jgi:cyclohexanone monooxygenase
MPDPQQPSTGGVEPGGDVDVVIVGAGFSGLYMVHRVRRLDLTARLIEEGGGVGGTWYWNRYPGAHCDVESTDYQYGFDDEIVQDWTWTERYASQPEILAYLNRVADRLDVRREIQLETRVTGAVFDETTSRWTVSTDRGASFSARHCVMATGCLSAVRMPDVEGLDSFAGDWYHTARWPHEGVDFTGKRVAVIGTGSSAIQAIPLIAEQAAHLTVFQRTPNFSVPAHNRPRDPEDERRMKEGFASNRRNARESSMGVFASWVPNEASALEAGDEERQREFEAGWNRGGFGFLNAFSDLVTSREANELAAEFVRNKIRGIVHDPDVAELLCPNDHPFGTKRLCVDTGYFETYNRDNVALHDLKSTPIEAITPTGVRTRDGELGLDVIVFATGFDAMTGAVLDIDIRGRGGMTLGEKWAAGPCTYLGVQIAGFPNLFLITGPGSPSVLSNMIVSIEQHVDWIADCLAYLREHHLDCIEATLEAENEWVEHVNERADRTLLPEANSWYTGANIPGKPRVFMPYAGGVGAYRRRCNEIAARGYQGFVLSASRAVSESPA